MEKVFQGQKVKKMFSEWVVGACECWSVGSPVDRYGQSHMPCHATPALDTDTESSSSGMSRQETNTFHKTQKEERKKGRILNTKSEFRKRGRRQLWRNNFTFFFFCEIQRFIFPKNLLLFVCLRESSCGTFFELHKLLFRHKIRSTGSSSSSA